MKIAIITNYWKNSPGGGARNYVVGLYDHLKHQIKFEVDVIFRQGLDPSNYKSNQNKILFVIKTFAILKRIRPDIIQIFDSWYSLIPAVLFKKMFGCKIVVSFLSEPTGNFPRFLRLPYQKLINACDYTIVGYLGYDQKFDVNYKIKLKNVSLIRPAVNTLPVTEADIISFKEHYSINDDANILLIQGFTADEYKTKGTQLTISSIRRLINKFPSLILIITRDGKYSDCLKDYTNRIGVSKHVVFTGDLQNPFIPLSICDIFLFPYVGTFATGLALQEAMLVGKSIIMTSTGGTPEVIDNGINGIIITPDLNTLTESIKYLLEDRDFAQKLGSNAKKYAEENFSWEQFIGRYIDIYEK